MRVQVLMAARMKVSVFRYILPCSLVESCMVVRDGLYPNIWKRLSEYGKERS
jgi:hypothetical protein